jgi:hypothetical protein
VISGGGGRAKRDTPLAVITTSSTPLPVTCAWRSRCPSRSEPLLGALTGHVDLVVALVGGDRLFQSRSPPVGELLDAAREGADPYSGSPFSRGARSFCSARRFPVSAMSVM